MARIAFVVAVTVILLLLPVWLFAGDVAGAEHADVGEHHDLDLPWWSILPFIILLLTIAFLPLVASHFWEPNKNKAIVTAIIAVPLAIYLIALGREGQHALLHELGEYASFIILLASLYTVAGGIAVQGCLKPTPTTNATFLAIGAVLANLIGTTGASILLIRPVLRINKPRLRVAHIPIFFIFIVSNVAGLLTPLGDPPLFLGFLKGVDFFWTMGLWPQWLFVNLVLLGLFLIWDTQAYKRETQLAAMTPTKPPEPLRFLGLINVLFLAGILAAVIAQSPAVAGDYALKKPWGEMVMIVMGLLSWFLTPREARAANDFRWHAIVEVAVLFAGIFTTMAPALVLLQSHGSELAQSLNVSKPWHYFWLTGTLSSFLDNAPTYVTFATIAAKSSHFHQLSVERPEILAAISCGAVFMGANTYIGNGPNFMVKAIAEESGYHMPSFFGYILYTLAVLIPTYILVTLIFF
ncbi:MAG: sodium:proton antiporter [Gemmatales bacterium]|nr:sodium:proton antiporter [Gemmatales bacterium]MDW8388367.1 sodium:proton antiporter [Gemmatales bacterium]